MQTDQTHEKTDEINSRNEGIQVETSFDKREYKMKIAASVAASAPKIKMADHDGRPDSRERLHDAFKKHSIIDCIYGSQSSYKALSSANPLKNFSQATFDELDWDSMSMVER
jgi:hypothetical protein